MRRVTSFCVLVASILILIQGARSEHAFRQNDRPPNALERDADKYNRPQIPSKLPINQQDQTDACPVTEEALVESVQTTEKGIDSATVLPPCTKRVVTQNPSISYRRRDTSTAARRHRRRDTSTAARRHRRKDTDTRDVVRQTASRSHRRRDLVATDVVRRTTARRHRRKDTRNVARHTAARRDRQIDRGTRDVVRHRLVLRHRQSGRYSTHLGREVESRQVRRTLSPESRRNFRRMVDVSVRSRSTTHRNDKRERNSRFSRRDFRNTRGASYTRRTIRDSGEDIRVLTLPYQHNSKVSLYHTDSSYTTDRDDTQAVMHFTGASTKSRSSRHIRREVHRSRGDRHLSIREVSDASLSTVSRFPVNERGHRIDVRRRFRHSDRPVSRNTRRDVTKRFESMRISVPYAFNTISVIDQLTMQASKERNKKSDSFHSDRRVARRARLTRGYRRISSNDGLDETSKVVFLREFIDHVDNRDTNLENVEKSSNDRQYEMMPSKQHTSLDLDEVTTEKSVTKDNNVVEVRNTYGNRVILQRRRRQEGQYSRRRVAEKRSVSQIINKYRRSNDVRIRQGSRQVYNQRNSRRDSRNGRSALRHLTNAQHRARRLKRSSNDDATRRSALKDFTDNQNNFLSDVTRVNTERRFRYKQARQRERSTRRVRRLRVARAAEAKHSDESKITDYRTFTGHNLRPSAGRQQTRTSRYFTTNYGLVRRSRRNSRIEGRRSREVRSRRAQQRVADRRISENVLNLHYIQGHQNSYLTENNFGLPLFGLVESSRKPEAVVGGMARSRRSRHSERHRKLPLYSPKALIVTTKSLDTQPPNIDVDLHVDQPHVSLSEQHVSSKLSGAVDYCLNYLFSCANAFQNNQHSEQGTFSDDTSQGTYSCTRGVMLGVVAVLSTQVVQGMSAPSLPLGRIRHGLLA